MAPLAIFLYMLPVEFIFSYQQMRFFAAETPFLYLGVPYLLRSASDPVRNVYFALGSASLFSMITTGFLRTVASPPDAVEIIPSLFYYLPPLLRYYRIRARMPVASRDPPVIQLSDRLSAIDSQPSSHDRVAATRR